MSMSMPTQSLAAFADAAFTPQQKATFEAFVAAVDAKGRAYIEIIFASLPRKMGKGPLGGTVVRLGAGTIDLAAFRATDLAAALLLDRVEAAERDSLSLKLYSQGDPEERRMILKALTVLDDSAAALPLLETAHRTNDMTIFESAYADSDWAARVLPADLFNNAVLKCAFNDVPLARLLGAAGRATPALSRMLLDFMSEREAAQRPCWAGSLELAAHAPCPGVRARILGDLWHGSDARRFGAVRAAHVLGTPEMRAEIELRRPFEKHGPTLALMA